MQDSVRIENIIIFKISPKFSICSGFLKPFIPCPIESPEPRDKIVTPHIKEKICL